MEGSASEDVGAVAAPVAQLVQGAKRRKPQKTNKVTKEQQQEVSDGKLATFNYYVDIGRYGIL